MSQGCARDSHDLRIVLQQEVVDALPDEEVDDLHLPAIASASPRAKLQQPKEKPREEQLEYQKSVPYETETLEEMDRRLEEILRRLVDCVRAKD